MMNELKYCPICGKIKLKEDTIPDGVCGECEWEMEEDE